ncbi:endospore germination permease [Lutibacter sp. B2]|nr:endospore germination permease [Lutibacter sp. B2]
MNKEVISDKQGISIISLFIIGSSIVLTVAGKAKKDVWIAIIFSILTALPIVWVHARLLVLFPGRDLYDVLELVFGKFIGRGISLLFIGFSFFLGGLVLRVFGDFISTVSSVAIPGIVPMLFMGALCIWAVKEGIETIGRWAEFFLIGTIVLILIVNLLLINKMNINNLRPILYEGIKPVVDGAFHAFIFPFTQTIVFTTFFSSLKNKSVYKVYIVGLLIGGFIKVCMCLLSTCNGIAKIFGFNDYRFIVTPIGLLIINLSYFIHDNVMEKAAFASDIYPSYAFPFQVILPISILIVAEIKKKQLT